jgi:hypothetical protein
MFLTAEGDFPMPAVLSKRAAARLKASTKKRRSRFNRRSFQPALEILENRRAPAVFTVNTTHETAANLATGQDNTGHVTVHRVTNANTSAAGIKPVGFSLASNPFLTSIATNPLVAADFEMLAENLARSSSFQAPLPNAPAHVLRRDPGLGGEPAPGDLGPARSTLYNVDRAFSQNLEQSSSTDAKSAWPLPDNELPAAVVDRVFASPELPESVPLPTRDMHENMRSQPAPVEQPKPPRRLRVVTSPPQKGMESGGKCWRWMIAALLSAVGWRQQKGTPKRTSIIRIQGDPAA